MQTRATQTSTPRKQPTTERKPTQGDKKSWQLFDGDLDIILSVALQGEVDRKIRILSAITYAVEKERFGIQERKALKPFKPNRDKAPQKRTAFIKKAV
jgi:hypothetical protein